MLGAGFVTKPTLDILSEAGIKVTVGAYMQLGCLGQVFSSFSSWNALPLLFPSLPSSLFCLGRHKLDVLDMLLACVVLRLRPAPRLDLAAVLPSICLAIYTHSSLISMGSY